jgi:hypothetical protein
MATGSHSGQRKIQELFPNLGSVVNRVEISRQQAIPNFGNAGL